MRRTNEEIFSKIYAVLSENSLKSVTQIATSVKSHYSTVKMALKLIELIQSKPKLIFEKMEGNKVLVKVKKEEKTSNQNEVHEK